MICEGVKKLITDLNRLYKTEPALYENNLVRWIRMDYYSDHQNAVISFIRKSQSKDDVIVVCNFLR
jgi:1,4-alpha-glucan branching enzyme